MGPVPVVRQPENEGIRLAKYFSYILAGDIGEGALVLWLLIIGVNVKRWKEQARAAGQ